MKQLHLPSGLLFWGCFPFFLCRMVWARRCWLGQEVPARLRVLLVLPGAGCGVRMRRQKLSQCSASCKQPWEPLRGKANQAEASSLSSCGVCFLVCRHFTHHRWHQET